MTVIIKIRITKPQLKIQKGKQTLFLTTMEEDKITIKLQKRISNSQPIKNTRSQKLTNRNKKNLNNNKESNSSKEKRFNKKNKNKLKDRKKYKGKNSQKNRRSYRNKRKKKKRKREERAKRIKNKKKNHQKEHRTYWQMLQASLIYQRTIKNQNKSNLKQEKHIRNKSSQRRLLLSNQEQIKLGVSQWVKSQIVVQAWEH